MVASGRRADQPALTATLRTRRVQIHGNCRREMAARFARDSTRWIGAAVGPAFLFLPGATVAEPDSEIERGEIIGEIAERHDALVTACRAMASQSGREFVQRSFRFRLTG